MKRFKKLSNWVLWAGFAIPLNQQSALWHVPAFSKLKPNKVTFNQSGLKIEVDSSSSPIFYELPKLMEIKKIQADGQLYDFQAPNSGDFPPDADDLPLRIGLVETSDSEPSWLQKLLSPRWIRDLFEWFPSRGINKVRFFTVSPNQTKGTSRDHPKSNLLQETVVLQQKEPGPFHINYTLDPPALAQGIWIQSDGDDTHIRFSVLIEKLSLEYSK